MSYAIKANAFTAAIDAEIEATITAACMRRVTIVDGGGQQRPRARLNDLARAVRRELLLGDVGDGFDDLYLDLGGEA